VNGQVFEARPSRGKVLLMLAGALALIAGSVFIILNPGEFAGRRGGAFALPAAWAGLLFFGLCALFIGRMLFLRAVQLKIDVDGLHWSRWSDAPIPFSEMAEAWPLAMMGQNMLCIAFHHPERHPAKSPILRAGAKANRSMGAGDMAISMNGLDRSFDELMSAFAHWASRAGVPVRQG
jgi:hypothetical protein